MAARNGAVQFWHAQVKKHDIDLISGPAVLIDAIDDLFFALRQPPCSIVLVSNEVGSGVVPAYELGRRFRDLVGEINQRVASVADTVLLMVAGLPFPLKGSVPKEVKQ